MRLLLSYTKVIVIISYPGLFLPAAVAPYLHLQPLHDVNPSRILFVRYYACSSCTHRTSTSLVYESVIRIYLLRLRTWSFLRYATSEGQTHRDYCRILLRLHRSFKVCIRLDETSCPEAGGYRPGYTSALSAQRGSNPGNKITAQLRST